MPLKIQSGQTLLFIGDSITDCNRRAAFAPLGNGYVKMFADLAILREPAKKIALIDSEGIPLGCVSRTVSVLQTVWI
jgi:hypothetical protein